MNRHVKIGIATLVLSLVSFIIFNILSEITICGITTDGDALPARCQLNGYFIIIRGITLLTSIISAIFIIIFGISSIFKSKHNSSGTIPQSINSRVAESNQKRYNQIITRGENKKA